ncbi:MAG: hypothetical protein ABIH66_05375 [bacterium]
MKKTPNMTDVIIGLLAGSWIIIVTVVYYFQYMEKILGFLKR